MRISTRTYGNKYTYFFPSAIIADYHITEVSEVMKPMHRNGLKGHQHIAQGIALGRRTIVKFALKGHKPYHASLCFCPCRAPLLRFALTQDDALGWELYGLPGRPAELPKLKILTEVSEVKAEEKWKLIRYTHGS